MGIWVKEPKSELARVFKYGGTHGEQLKRAWTGTHAGLVEG